MMLTKLAMIALYYQQAHGTSLRWGAGRRWVDPKVLNSSRRKAILAKPNGRSGDEILDAIEYFRTVNFKKPIKMFFEMTDSSAPYYKLAAAILNRKTDFQKTVTKWICANVSEVIREDKLLRPLDGLHKVIRSRYGEMLLNPENETGEEILTAIKYFGKYDDCEYVKKFFSSMESAVCERFVGAMVLMKADRVSLIQWFRGFLEKPLFDGLLSTVNLGIIDILENPSDHSTGEILEAIQHYAAFGKELGCEPVKIYFQKMTADQLESLATTSKAAMNDMSVEVQTELNSLFGKFLSKEMYETFCNLMQ